MFRLETIRNELRLQGLNYLSGAFLSSPKRGAVRSAELGCFLSVDPWLYVQHKTALTLSSEQFLWGEPSPWLLRGRCEELTEESFAVGVKLLPEHHCALAAGQVLTEGS